MTEHCRPERFSVFRQKGATIKKLATQIKLDYNECDKWLKLSDKGYVSKKHKIISGEKYSIPNIVYVNDLTALVAWWGWQLAEERTLRNQGFMVLEKNDPDRLTILGEFAGEDTYGVVTIGHGEDTDKGDIKASDHRLSPGSIKGVLHHKMGGIKNAVCWGGYKFDEWWNLVAPRGFFFWPTYKLFFTSAQPGIIKHGF